MAKPYHLFISFASEDQKYAGELEEYLRFRGLKVWFSPLSLEPGDKLLNSINLGMMASEFGVMLISERYISKPWPNHEADVLNRQHIEEQKKLFPIMHGVSKAQIDAWNPGLSGIVWMNSDDGPAAVAEKIAKIIYRNSPTIGVTPSWENPQWRFIHGQGELLANTESGWVFNLFEAARFSDDKFPLYVYDRQYSKREIISAVASLLFYNNSDAVCLTPAIREEMLPICKANGFDVESSNFDAAVHCIHNW